MRQVAWLDARWRWVGLVIGLTSLGLALRLFRIGANSYWLDEAISVLIAHSSVPAILSNAGCSSHPGLYYLLLHYWVALGGESEAWVRGMSALIGASTVPLLVILGSALFDRRVGLVAGLLFALSPFHVAYSQEARMYAQVTCLGVAGLLCFYRAVEGGSRRWWVAAGVAMALAMVTHLFAGLLLAAMNLYTLVYHRDRAAWLRLVLIDLVAVAVVTPHILGMFAESQQTLGGLRPLAGRGRPSLLFPLTATYLLMAGYSITPVIVPVALFGSLLTFAFTLLEVSGAFRRRKAARRALTLLLLVVGFVLLGPFTSALVYPFFLPERSLLIGLPALIVLIAWGIAGSKRRTPLRVLGICLGCIMLFSLWGYYFDPRFQKPPMRDAAAFVRGRVAVGDAVLHTSDGSYLPFLVYEHPADNFLLTGDPDPRKPEAVYELWGGSMVERDTLTSEYRRVWLVVALEHSLEFQREALTWFEDRYTMVEKHNVGGIGIYLFDLAGEASGESP